MRRISTTFLAAALVAMAVCASALAARPIDRSKASFTLAGKVLRVDKKAQTMLVADAYSEKIYLVKVPANAAFKITFGRGMHLSQPSLADVFKNDRISARCTRDRDDHLGMAGADRPVLAVVAAR